LNYARPSFSFNTAAEYGKRAELLLLDRHPKGEGRQLPLGCPNVENQNRRQTKQEGSRVAVGYFRDCPLTAVAGTKLKGCFDRPTPPGRGVGTVPICSSDPGSGKQVA